jgi:hypothetical protein
MLKSQMIKTLTESIEQDGDTPVGERALIEMFAPDRLREYDARQEIIRNIIRAKRDLKAPMECNFFADIWPKALAAMKAERE